MSQVYVQVMSKQLCQTAPCSLTSAKSLQAVSAVVKASSAEIRGTFKVTQQLTLETVSAYVWHHATTMGCELTHCQADQRRRPPVQLWLSDRTNIHASHHW